MLNRISVCWHNKEFLPSLDLAGQKALCESCDGTLAAVTDCCFLQQKDSPEVQTHHLLNFGLLPMHQRRRVN